MHPRRLLSTLRATVVLAVAATVVACGPGASLAPTGPTSPPATGTAAPATEVPTQAACVSDTTPDPSVTGELSVYDWAGYDAEIFWQDFKNKYANVKVTFDATGASDADI